MLPSPLTMLHPPLLLTSTWQILVLIFFYIRFLYTYPTYLGLLTLESLTIWCAPPHYSPPLIVSHKHRYNYLMAPVLRPLTLALSPSQNPWPSLIYCVPSFNFNLISASKLTHSPNTCLIFLKNLYFIQDHFTWTTKIGLTKVHHGLYFLVLSSLYCCLKSHALAVHCNNSFTSPVFDLWHFRLGHLSSQRLKLIQSTAPNVNAPDVFKCIVCPLPKEKHNSFPSSVTQSTFAFDLIHVDIYGPYS